MEEKFRTNIVIFPKGSAKIGCAFVIFIFVPVLIGLVTDNNYLFWSVPFGCLILFFIHDFSDNKNNSANLIQQSSFVEFDPNKIRVIEKDKEESFNWENLEGVVIRIHEYKGEVTIGAGETINQHTGLRNYVEFNQNSSKYRYGFYLDSSSDKACVISLFQEHIIPRLERQNRIKRIMIRK